VLNRSVGVMSTPLSARHRGSTSVFAETSIGTLTGTSRMPSGRKCRTGSLSSSQVLDTSEEAVAVAGLIGQGELRRHSGRAEPANVSLVHSAIPDVQYRPAALPCEAGSLSRQREPASCLLSPWYCALAVGCSELARRS